MIAILTSFLILVYFAILGTAVASCFARQIRPALALVTPAIGLGLILPIELTLSRSGLPVETFGALLTWCLGIVAIGILVIRRPMLPWRSLLPCGPAVFAAIALAAAPMLRFGFHWFANVNDDMLVYVVSAGGFLHDGFFHLPTLTGILAGTNPSDNTWYWEIFPPNRYGTDALLALAAAATRIDPIYIYMPCTVAAFGALVMATGGLCQNAGAPRWLAPAAAGVIAVASPLTQFSLYQQLLPQVLGIVAMTSVVALVQIGDDSRSSFVQRGFCLGCILSGFSYVYPEISPIMFMGGLICFPFALRRRFNNWRGFLGSALRLGGVATATFLLLLNVQVFTFFGTATYLSGAATKAATSGGVTSIFYFLLPSGFANFWGFIPLASYPPEPLLSLAIVAGIACVAGLIILASRSLWRGTFYAAMVLAMLVLMGQLFILRSSYPLFKMAFLIQPFLAPFVAIAVVWVGRAIALRTRMQPRIAIATAFVALLACQYYSTSTYFGSSSDMFVDRDAAFVELHGASTHDLMGQIEAIGKRYASNIATVPFLSDAMLPQMALMQGHNLRGHSLEFPAIDFWSGLYYFASNSEIRVKEIAGWPAGVRDNAKAVALERVKIPAERNVPLGKRQVWVHQLAHIDPAFVRPMVNADQPMFLETGRNLSILNNSSQDARDAFDVRAVPWQHVRNWLGIINSELGAPPTDPNEFANISLGWVEPDPARRGGLITTLGRSALFEVFRGTPTVRLRIAVTASYNPEGYTDLEPISVIGQSRITFNNLGEGSARILTPPIRLIERYGHRYVAVIFGHRVVMFPEIRSGLMALFGRDVKTDYRQFTLFGRDVSVEDVPLAPPGRLDQIPRDLFNPSLLYSGLYEDGWLGSRFSVVLRSSAVESALRLNVMVPPSTHAQVVALIVDGRVRARLQVRPAAYMDVRLLGVMPGDHTITVEPSETDRLSVRDVRKTWGRLRSIGFEKAASQDARHRHHQSGRILAGRDAVVSTRALR
jgi:hypothetical protein